MANKIPNGTTTEMQTFLPRDESAINGNVTTYKVTKDNDLEAANDFDPFKARVLDHPVTNCDTLTHLLKASLGTGILSMPAAFKASGLVLGIFTTIVVSIICTHCAYILVASAHELYKRVGRSSLSFAEVAEEACLRGPKWARKFGWIANKTVLWGIFVTYFATCSCYTVIIARNILYVTDQYYGDNSFNVRYVIALLLIPLILLAFVPNLKYLAPVSMVANVCMALGLGITFYYLVKALPAPSSVPAVADDLATLPICISVVIFAIEAIGVVMPLENNMSTPRSFIGICGVLNQGMSFVTLMYILLGFLGYLKYGEETKDSITYNLPKGEIAAQAVNILVAIAVFCTYGLQFYVCLDIAWGQLKDKVSKRETVANYTMRAILVSLSVLIAVAVPTIVPFVGLIGAFCFSILGLMCPVFIEILTFWDKGFGFGYWKIIKNVIIVLVGFLALIFGSKSSIQDIIKLFTD